MTAFRLLLLAVILGSNAASFAQEAALPPRNNEQVRASPNAMVSQTVGTTLVMVQYGRPAVNGRTIYGELVPYGEMWRIGANEATVVLFSKPVRVNGQDLAGGAYALFVIPTATTWTVVFNNTASQWGAYRYDAAQDALRLTVQPTASAAVEQLRFTIDRTGDRTARIVYDWAGMSFGLDIAEVDSPAME